MQQRAQESVECFKKAIAAGLPPNLKAEAEQWLKHLDLHAVREFFNKSAASAASPDYVKFQAVIKSAASAAPKIHGTQVQGSARATGDGGTTGTAGRRIGSDDGTGRSPGPGFPGFGRLR